ncbi:PREDICTED: VPS10 domain-containing receptor SorCS1-like [Amphimedon queenslandica]|uniref:PKD domain-containing protein n=1 Tax=Amphimedon queenslandica TaxID=400682 RepID=A0A1X7UWT9_AMPQE|nr:PREDICTED: VPS10 domain-containing receptor SorCS1-like [Amphimedon queenslandica]|eukprot:XP_011403900.1 PREDICTED: VPS10 domain-containing receptor SorCS1-like [Amphimedon queenslandica]
MQAVTRQGFLFLLFLFSFLFGSTLAVVHGPKLPKGAVRQPLVVKIDSLDEPLGSVYQKATKQAREQAEKEDKEDSSLSRERQLRSLPDVAPNGFGTTVVLENDPHTFALVHWSGLPKKRIFILTRDRDSDGNSRESYLWLSTDYGKSFQNITGRVYSNQIILEWYYVSSDADKLIFADVIHRNIYVTLDEGDTFIEYHVNFSPDKFTFQHSYVPNVAKYDSYVLGYDNTLQTLWVSNNTGATWSKLGANVTRYEWRQLNSTYEDGSTVYFDMKINATACQLYKATLSTYNSSSQPLFDASLGVFMPNSFALSYQYMFTQRNYSDVGRPTTGYISPLWVSHYRKAFKAASFSLQLDERHYAMVDGSEGQVLMGVYHDPNNTNLYISEEAGLNYSLSLEHLISPPESDWIDSYPTFDVYVVEGIPGTYLVNRRVYGSTQGATVISFDKGGEWKPLNPPTTDASGHLINCNLPCSLHLHMYIDESHGFQPILSQDSAPNIIMALGNLGLSLNRYNYYALRLYISDNGGVTWRELASGYKEFQLINFGVFTSIVAKWTQTSTVQSSCDEGQNWSTYTFTNASVSQRIYVVRMFTEYGEESQHATVFGYRPDATYANFEWLVIDLDFTVLNISNCNASDYYQWRPTDEREGQLCILGESVEYERRYPDHCCMISSDYERPISRKPCFCTFEDFECQVGFERVGLSGECSPMAGTVYPPNPPIDCFEGNNYSYPSPYRRIAGDKCKDGNETFYQSVMVRCPVLPPADMTITTDNYHVRANTEVTFTLEQRSGGKAVTFYSWSFDDNTPTSSPPIKGFDSASTQRYTYTVPGAYNVTVFAKNDAGNNTAHITIFVLDKVVDFTVMPKIARVTQKSVYFLENITTLHNTLFIEPGTYTWDFGDNTPTETEDIKAVEHTYWNIGNYTLTVTFANIYGIKMNHFPILVENVTSPLHLNATLNSNPLQTDSFIPVGKEVLFTVTPYQPDTTYDWVISHAGAHGGTPLLNSVGTATSKSFTFSEAGRYVVRVSSNNYIGASQVSRLFTVEYPIARATLTFKQPVYRINKQVDAVLAVLGSSSSYSGNLYINLHSGDSSSSTSGSQDSTALLSTFLTVANGATTFSFIAPEAGTVSVNAELHNNVSSVTTKQTLMVAGPGAYGYVRVIFKTLTKFDYNDYQVQLDVQNGVKNKILSSYAVLKWQLSVNVSLESNATVVSGPRKRSGAADQQYLIAHVTILPKTLSSDDVLKVQTLSKTIAADINDGNTTFTVRNTTLKATADLGPTIFIYDPYPVDHNSKDYKPLIIGLGTGTVLLVVVALVIVGVVIYYYKKKYRSLEVRYTRLRQGPMRFTFSSEGETLEEEDWRNDEEDTGVGEVEEEINNDEHTLHSFPPINS